MDYHFEQVDVFTKRRFAGNPLAVFTDGRALSPSDMQQIAREMNLSETTFIVPPTQPECVAKYYIFTPDQELPFAGHPTVGTAFVLARLNASRSQSGTMNLEAAVGKVAVRLEGRKDDPETVFFTSPPVKFGSRFTDQRHTCWNY
jgi:trans-2,3-dihydro-3-hydroxyanthranilate isomerase